MQAFCFACFASCCHLLGKQSVHLPTKMHKSSQEFCSFLTIQKSGYGHTASGQIWPRFEAVLRWCLYLCNEFRMILGQTEGDQGTELGFGEVSSVIRCFSIGKDTIAGYL